MKACLEKEVLPAYPVDGVPAGVLPYGDGHINDTYAAYYQMNDGSMRRFIAQRINTEVFTDPKGLMENIVGVTDFLRERILERGGDPRRETLTVHRTGMGDSFFTDRAGGVWRLYDFIEGTKVYQIAKDPEPFYAVAYTLGMFQRQLAAYPAASLHETIPNFHNTPNRYVQFEDALRRDVCGRAKEVREEEAFVREREAFAHTLMDAQRRGDLPLRVTHNDTKLNNVLIDAETGRGLCVIDLDTVMPGFAAYDFGDSIRSGASTALEDERDLSKVGLDLELFGAFARGFLAAAGEALTPFERQTLPIGAKMMTLECGVRFLTDYLNGDVYFKTHREGQNLDRARTQFRLVADMEDKWEEMNAAVRAG